MALLVSYENLCNISDDFYNLFNPEIDTNEHFKLRIELAKYVEHAKFSHDVAYNDCQLTFKEWATKHKIINDKLNNPIKQ